MGIRENKVSLEWDKLGFSYIKTDYRYRNIWKEGEWSEGEMVADNNVAISEGSTVFHYGQSAFEGLKAYSRKDGKVNLFRPDRNAKRLADSAGRVLMAEVPEKIFIDACIQTVRLNKKWIPPYGTGANFYLRPFLIGIGDNLGVKPAPEYLFSVFGVPVGPYFKGGLKPVNFSVSEMDRAAPAGTGRVKVGGNYGGSLLPHEKAVKNGFADCIYLDPLTHKNIEEVGAANFFGITANKEFITPKSESILPSITKYSLMEIADKYLGLKVLEEDVPIDGLDRFTEAGACGTAAVITPIGGIEYQGKLHTFYAEGNEVGPYTRQLYDILVGIQYGDIEAPQGWIVEIDL